jgi:EmrB/QacA subfamily drug resistance transporter
MALVEDNVSPGPGSLIWGIPDWTLGVLSVSLIVIALDVTILNVAIPTLQRELNASAAALQWIVNAYILVFAGLLLTMGALGDKFGRRRALEVGLVIFGLASLGAAYAETSSLLIVARVAQGIGGALIMPSTLSILVDVFPREERAKAIGIWAGVAAIGIPLGMIVGGWLLESYWCGVVFLINIPVALGALIAGRFLVPESKDASAPKLDLPAAAISMLGLSLLIYTIIEAPERGWLDPLTLAGFAATIVIGTAFALYELRVAHPMLDVRLFRNARLSGGVTAVGVAFMAMLGTMFIITQYFQFVRDYSPLDTGYRMAPMAVGFMIGAPVSAILVSRVGTKWTVAFGLVVLGSAVAMLSTLDISTSVWVPTAALLVFGIGGANAMAPATDAVMAALPDAQAGVGSALNDTTRQVGGALGVGIFGSVLNSLYTSNVAEGVVNLSEKMTAQAENSIGGALSVASDLEGPASEALTTAAKSAFIDASSPVYVAVGSVAILGAVIAVAFLPSRDTDSVDELGSTSTDGLTPAAAPVSID